MISIIVLTSLILHLSYNLCDGFYSGCAVGLTFGGSSAATRHGLRSPRLFDQRLSQTYSNSGERDNTTELRRCHYDLTIIIPAYNERERIGGTLSRYIQHLSQLQVYQHVMFEQDDPSSSVRSTGSASVLVIDDGSTDGTADFVREKSYLTKLPSRQSDCWDVDTNVECITLAQNEGKGAAVERGIQEVGLTDVIAHESGTIVRRIVLVADADGSGNMSCLLNMIQQLESLLQMSPEQPVITNDALVVGYRECKEKSLLRSILSWGFRTAVSSIFLGSNLGVRDTQCGFKLMTLHTGVKLYSNLNLRRWTHDVEVVHRAQLMGVPVGECKVPWIDVDGSKLVTSKLSAVKVSSVMLKEIAEMRIKYATGEWRVNAA